MNIVITVDENIKFSLYDRKTFDLNKQFYFADDYIKNNMQKLSEIFNGFLVKKDIREAIIEDNSVSEVVLQLIKHFDKIEKVTFSEDKMLDYTTSSLLLENKQLKKINCYELPCALFSKFENDIIETRNELLFFSDFMLSNNIDSYSKLYNKKSIKIDCNLMKDDDEIKFFLEKNTDLKKIYLSNYNKEALQKIISYLDSTDKINIYILENEDVRQNIFADIEYFKQFSNHIIIKIKYSKKYQDENKIQHLGYMLLKYVLIVVVVLSIILIIVKNFTKKVETTKTIETIEKIEETIVEVEENTEIQQEIVEEVVDEVVEEEIKPVIQSSYQKNYSKIYNELIKINPDTIGWLTVKQTQVNYPVVQAGDNNYYLSHDFEKKQNYLGWIYADYRNNFDTLNKNTIIYGHEVRNGNLMFSTLKNTIQQNWYENANNLLIEFNIKNNNYKWKIFSIYVVDKTSDYLKVNFNNSQDYLTFITMIKSRSIKDFGVEVNANDNILTLSTCYNGSNQRLVIHAKMIKDR